MKNNNEFSPNLSEREISEKCKGCGKCCKEFSTWYPYPSDYPSAMRHSELIRILMLSELGDKLKYEEHEKGIKLIYPFPCQYLAEDNTCMIYDLESRPLLCRVYPYYHTTKEECPHTLDDPDDNDACMEIEKKQY